MNAIKRTQSAQELLMLLLKKENLIESKEAEAVLLEIFKEKRAKELLKLYSSFLPLQRKK